MKEVWESVEGFPDYLVSNIGRVYNWKTMYELTQRQKTNGHVSVELGTGTNRRTVTKMVSRLVAEALIGTEVDKVVRHINGDVADNRVENLEYCTRSEIQQLISNRPTGRKTTKRVRVVETGEIFASVTGCAKAFNVTRSAISQVLLKKSPTAAGHRFEYADED